MNWGKIHQCNLRRAEKRVISQEKKRAHSQRAISQEKKELTQRMISQDRETAISLCGMVSVDKAGVPTEIFILKHRGETALKFDKW